ncbi:hypothetical protein [Anaerobiospirillum sp. NML120449]|uniref:hypothetical protein n=1 Tax=Anaerobiospirillum sp. NML120449 TaxID=2932817 RepID=UPI001FF67F16|nr:hypothetical protein [Anaerobiospirillum sp. NML120449]MCK0527554.1 hypothetical protein [Anaerobiospirillum sp. NML120449]
MKQQSSEQLSHVEDQAITAKESKSAVHVQTVMAARRRYKVNRLFVDSFPNNSRLLLRLLPPVRLMYDCIWGRSNLGNLKILKIQTDLLITWNP